MKTVKAGPLRMYWIKRNKVNGRRELPWEILTLENLSEPARLAITRVARSAAKDYIAEHGEQVRERDEELVRILEDDDLQAVRDKLYPWEKRIAYVMVTIKDMFVEQFQEHLDTCDPEKAAKIRELMGGTR